MNQSILNRARNDKFILVLDLPKILKNSSDANIQEFSDINKLQFSCFGSPVPAISIDPVDVPYGNQVYKTSSNFRKSYPPLQVKFLVDNGWKNYWLLAKWINLFNDTSTAEPSYNFKDNINIQQNQNTNKIPLRDLVSIFKTYALDEFNNRIMEFEFNHAFPISLSEINFSHQDPSEITCTVSFSFFQFKPNIIKNVDSSTC